MHVHTTHREPFAPPIEFVERKGIGHPDTLCDLLAERMANRIARHFLTETGEHRHFNVDKALLAAGAVDVGFGGGTCSQRSRVVLAGKADLRVAAPDVDELVEGARADLEELVPGSHDHFDVEVWLNPSSSDLLPVLSDRPDGLPLANDTSFAVISRDRSPLEAAVHAVASELDRLATSGEQPIGRDIKVMGHRDDLRTHLTVAVAFRADGVSDMAEYRSIVDFLQLMMGIRASSIIGGLVTCGINQGDRAGMPYLTVTGTSAEAGDDGQVGRGNRFGGLITPHRPMSLEATAGKNPVGHVGKTYHAVAWDLAGDLPEEATVRILSRIGNPITEPEAIHVESPIVFDAAVVEDMARTRLDDWRGVADRFLAGEYPVV